MNKLEQKALSELESLQRQSLRRYLRSFDSFSGPTITLNGQLLINFSSNDYLGLATAPFLRKAFADAALTYGVGSAASRLISGTLPPHTLLESAIAHFKQTEAALCFASGWQTAAGVIPAIVSQNDVILLDKLAHACLVDAARLSGAKLRVFP
ncbi:MAG: aminotransferase class I/II-fold pyridoxal phosphate-dependent enzyme, partial [Chthoniobacterales bacterium]|nr:aminotransferase class I/II-fold pyridoxal phosphate-dependent enzyme [Chthoniobacterales bacterium]